MPNNLTAAKLSRLNKSALLDLADEVGAEADSGNTKTEITNAILKAVSE